MLGYWILITIGLLIVGTIYLKYQKRENSKDDPAFVDKQDFRTLMFLSLLVICLFGTCHSFLSSDYMVGDKNTYRPVDTDSVRKPHQDTTTVK